MCVSNVFFLSTWQLKCRNILASAHMATSNSAIDHWQVPCSHMNLDFNF